MDEARGFAYGLERNHHGGAFYRWPLSGGRVEWLNHQAIGGSLNAQYVTDVGRCFGDGQPSGHQHRRRGYVYIGGVDGRTFRRYNLDGETIESLCCLLDAPRSAHLGAGSI